MAATASHVRSAEAPVRRARGAKTGFIRPPKRARVRSAWPGDVTAWSAAALDGADVPSFLSPPRHARATIVRLAFAEGAMIALSASYAVLVYAWR